MDTLTAFPVEPELQPDHSQRPKQETKSKNALKRERRQEFWQGKKQDMKRQKKEQKRLRKVLLGEAEDANSGDTQVKEVSAEVLEARRQRREEEKKEFLERTDRCYSVVIDCNFESAHNDKSLQSLGNQVSFCHSVNKKCTHPSRLYVSGVGQKLMDRFLLTQYTNWTGVSVHNEEFTEIEALKSKHLVYLTADSENCIEELDPGAAYIIGGIVDRNRLKGVTLEKANTLQISHARLPIKENVKLNSSQVFSKLRVYIVLKYSMKNFCPYVLT